MCVGGGGGGGGGGMSQSQIILQQQQMTLQAQESAAQLQEQQREFGITQSQNAASLAYEQQKDAANQAQVEQQQALTNEWEQGRSQEQQTATNDINNAFASFTPAYYNKYTQDYVSHYQPEVERQYAQAQNQTTYGLARQGNLNSQTAADQFQNLSVEKGTAEDDINNQAISATNALRQNTLNAKQNLMSQATSDATLGSPVTPGSADQIQADFNQTSSALSRLSNSAGDTVTTLQASPQYASLGSLFGTAASSAGTAVSGNNYYNFSQAFGLGAGGAGAASPFSGGSGG